MDTGHLTALNIKVLDAISLGEQASRISQLGRQVIMEIDALTKAATTENNQYTALFKERQERLLALQAKRQKYKELLLDEI